MAHDPSPHSIASGRGIEGFLGRWVPDDLEITDAVRAILQRPPPRKTMSKRLLSVGLPDQASAPAAAATNGEEVEVQAPAASEVAEAVPTIALGARVRLCGLKARPELNGELAVVQAYHGPSGRWRVTLERSGEALALRPEAVAVVPAA